MPDPLLVSEDNPSSTAAAERYGDDDLIMISALQHFMFCPRQCALIHIEQLWLENRFTAEGRILHDRVDTAGHQTRSDIRTVYGLPLRSSVLGLVGKADVVEFHRRPELGPGKNQWLPVPVEYKRGKPKKHDADLVQLCAQALCLEEMLHCPVPQGAVYYGKPRRRLVVDFDSPLQSETEANIRNVHLLLAEGHTPPARFEKKCESCSLLEICMPKVTGSTVSVHGYIDKVMTETMPARPEKGETL
jgi:CRISPR-associated exonuclease Cas4